MSIKVIKILIYEPYFFGMYGNSRYISFIAKYLDPSRYELTIVVPAHSSALEVFQGTCAKIIVLPPPPRLSLYGGEILRTNRLKKLLVAFSLLQYSYHIIKILLRQNIHIIQCHNLRSLATVGLAALLLRIPMIWYIKGDLENNALDRLGFMMATRILFQCNTTRALKYPELVRKYASKISILFNGIDLDHVSYILSEDKNALAQQLDISSDKFNICYLGQVYPIKGIEYLVRAIADVINSVPNIMCYLVGDSCVTAYAGHYEYISRLIRELHLDRHIKLIGWRDDALSILSLCDLLILPSLSEGVPKCIVEAMALGKPVIATRVGGIPELVRSGSTGFIVEPRDVKGISENIKTFAMNQHLLDAFGQEAMRIAHSEYSVKDNISRLQSLYTSITLGE